jgi:lysophospholipase L1-like esterase
MKKTLFILCLLIISLQAYAQKVYSANSPEVTYIGRFLRDDAGVRADWSGAMAIVRFEGKSLTLSYGESGEDYLNIWVDQEPGVEADNVIHLAQGEGEIELCSFKKKGEHTVYIQKRSEGEYGCITFAAFKTDGILLQARPWKERVMEIVGDSYTCGYGAEAADRDCPFVLSEENCNKSYSGILGRFFDADVVRISHSGRGIARNYGDSDPGRTMPVRYPGVFDEAEGPLWTPDYTPDIVVIYLGTNDFSVGKQPTMESWREGYKTLLQEIREFHGNEVPILCVASNADPMLADYVRTVATQSGIPNVHWTAINKDGHNITSDMGASWHPNHQGMRKVASLMAPYIATLTGWPFPVGPIE